MVAALALAAAPRASAPQGSDATGDRSPAEWLEVLRAEPEASGKRLRAILDAVPPPGSGATESPPAGGADAEAAHRVRFEAAYRLAARLADDPGRADERYAALRMAHASLVALERPPAVPLGRVAHELARLLPDRAPAGEAIEVLAAALRKLPAGHAYRGYVSFPLVDLLQNHGRVYEALALADAVHAEIEEHAGPAEIAHAVAGLRGLILLRQGLPDRAAPDIYAAFEFEHARWSDPEQTPNAGGLISACENLCALLRTSRRHERALELLEPVLDDASLFEQHGHARAGIRLNLALVHLELELAGTEPPGAAEAYLEEALGEPELRADDRARALALRAYAALRAGRREQAERDAAAARSATARATVPARERALLAALEARLARSAGRPVDAEGRGRLTAAAEALVAEWRDLAPRPGGLGFLLHPLERFALLELFVQHVDADGAAAALERLMEVQAASSLARLLDAPAGTAEEVRAHLVPAGGTLVVAWPALERMLVFAVREEDVAAREVSLPADFRQRVRQLVRWLDDPTGPPVSELARELGTLLFADGPAGPLAFVGRDLLGDLPLEALVLPSGRALGTSVAVSELPSLPVGLALARRAEERAGGGAERRPGTTTDLLLVTNARHSARARALLPGRGELDLDEAERRRLAGPLERSRVAELVGGDATRARLAAAGPRRARILHLFTHGVRDAGRESPAGLVLSPDADGDDGLLFGEDVPPLGAPPLVVLSACGTARGPERAGDSGAAHLGGAWLRAGADAVVLATGDVERAATQRLMEHFAAALAAGDAPAEALRSARAALAGSAAFAHPAHYARFRVLGLGHRPVLESAPGTAGAAARIGWGAVVAAVVLAALLGRARRRGPATAPPA